MNDNPNTNQSCLRTTKSSAWQHSMNHSREISMELEVGAHDGDDDDRDGGEQV